MCACVNLCALCACMQVPMEARRGCWAHWNWSCTQSWASVWVPRIQLRFSARTACAFNHSVSLRSNPCSFTQSFLRYPSFSHISYHKFITIPLLLPYFLHVSEFTWITILFISCLNLRHLKFLSECENCSLFSISIYPGVLHTLRLLMHSGIGSHMFFYNLLFLFFDSLILVIDIKI